MTVDASNRSRTGEVTAASMFGHTEVAATSRVIAWALLDSADRVFVRVLLWCGEPARDAWRSWALQAGDWTDPRQPHGQLAKAFAPLLLDALAREGVSVTYGSAAMRAWRLAERERTARYASILGEVLAIVRGSGVRTLLVGGGAFSSTLYDDVSHRHNHDIDLFVGGDDVGRVAALLGAAGFANDDATSGPHRLRMVHASGLPLVVRGGRLHHSSSRALSFDEVFAAQATATVAGIDTAVLGRAHALVLACLPSFTARRRIESVRATLDASRLVGGFADADWPALVETAARHDLSLLLLATLDWLTDEGRVQVPSTVRGALVSAASATLDRDGARLLPSLAGAPRTVRALLATPGGWRTRIAVARAMLLPPGDHVQPSGARAGRVALGGRHIRRIARWCARGPALT